MVADGCGFPRSDTGSAPRREVVTASGDRDTESTVAGRKSSGVVGIRAADTAAPSTTTHPTGLAWCGVFLM